MKCRVCGNNIHTFMSFGKMPLANGFLKEEDFRKEYFFDLSPAFCEACFTFQIETQPDPKMMFHENYPFFSKTSKHMQEHFRKYAKWVENNFISKKNAFVVELGSNDGILLENFALKGIKHLGIEPSAIVADVAIKNGVNTKVNFFNQDVAQKILKTYGNSDTILAANVMCHIPDLNEINKACKILLKDDGVLIFEDPYLGEMIKKVSFDQIYDEHVYIFSALAVQNIFSKDNFELIDLIPQNTHGGSMRYVLCKKGMRKISENVKKIIETEKKQNLDKLSTYIKFKENCETSKKRLVNLLEKNKKLGKKIVGYGATSKSTTLLNYCKIGPDLIAYISDTTPIKQNKYSPGMHIPIKSYENFSRQYPDIAVLFAWNHKSEIESKEKKFLEKGGKFISHIY